MAKLIEATVPATAQAATYDQVIGEAPAAGRVVSVSYTPEAAVTGAASPNSRTLTVVNKGAAGAGSTNVATLALVGSVNLVAFDEKEITLNATVANLTVEAGDVLVFVSTAVTGGGGLADPGGQVRIEIGSSDYSEPDASGNQTEL